MLVKSQGIVAIPSPRNQFLFLVLLALQVTTGCTKQRVYVQPSQLAAHADEFRNQGKARVEVSPSGTLEIKSAMTMRIRIPGKSKSVLWGLLRVQDGDETKLVSVGQLVANCGQAEPCLADMVRDTPAWIGTRRVFSPARLALGSFGFIATVGSVTCLAVCEDPHNAAYVGTAIAVTTLLYALSTAY